MIDKVKSVLSYILGVVVLILSGVLFSRNRKLERAESDLASAKSKGEIDSNEKDRQTAKSTANDLVAEYERLKRK